MEVVGIDIVPLASSVSSILAALAIIAVMRTAARRLRSEPRSDPHSRFIRLVTLGAGGLALLALLWVSLPPLLSNVGC